MMIFAEQQWDIEQRVIKVKTERPESHLSHLSQWTESLFATLRWDCACNENLTHSLTHTKECAIIYDCLHGRLNNKLIIYSVCFAADSQQHHLPLTSSCILSSFFSSTPSRSPPLTLFVAEGTNHAVPHGPSRLLPSSLCSQSMDPFSSRCQLNSKHLSTFNYHHLSEER